MSVYKQFISSADFKGLKEERKHEATEIIQCTRSWKT